MIANHYALEEWEIAFANLRARQDMKALIHPSSTLPADDSPPRPDRNGDIIR